jgi:DnaJ-class molecular chaperone
MLTVVAKDTALCPRCNGDGAVLAHIPNETESTYGWAGYVPCPHCGGCGHVRFGGPQ